MNVNKWGQWLDLLTLDYFNYPLEPSEDDKENINLFLV